MNLAVGLGARTEEVDAGGNAAGNSRSYRRGGCPNSRTWPLSLHKAEIEKFLIVY